MDPLGILSRITVPLRVRQAALVALALSLPACSSARGVAPPDSPTGPESDAGDRRVVATPSSPSRARSPVEFAKLESAIRRFASDRAGRLPVTLDELVTERSPDGDRYLASIPTDMWGRPYSYAVVSARLGSYDLRSYGPDTLPGTADDLVAEAKPVPTH